MRVSEPEPSAPVEAVEQDSQRSAAFASAATMFAHVGIIGGSTRGAFPFGLGVVLSLVALTRLGSQPARIAALLMLSLATTSALVTLGSILIDDYELAGTTAEQFAVTALTLVTVANLIVVVWRHRSVARKTVT